MEAHQQRVVDEKTELDEKRTKLDAFFNTPRFAALDANEQRRMRTQSFAMQGYSSILAERIAAFSAEPKAGEQIPLPTTVYEGNTRTGSDFGYALAAMRGGAKVAREGWNGKGLWVAYCDGNPALPASSFWNLHAREFARTGLSGTAAVAPYMILKTSQDTIQMGWAPSGSDALAEDWVIVD